MILADGQKTAVAEAFSQDGSCPASTSAQDTANGGKYVLTVATGGSATTTGGCTIVSTMRGTGSVSTGIVSKILTLTMTTTSGGGSMTWTCTSTANQKYLPKACAGTT